MTGRGRGSGVMWAGILVILIGLGAGALRAFEIPRYWMPVLVGAVLVAVGAVLRGHRRRRPWGKT